MYLGVAEGGWISSSDSHFEYSRNRNVAVVNLAHICVVDAPGINELSGMNYFRNDLTRFPRCATPTPEALALNAAPNRLVIPRS